MRFFRKKSDSYQSETQMILEFLQCECMVFSEGRCLEELHEVYKRAGNLGKSEGFIPIFIIPSKSFLRNIVRKPSEGILLSSLEDGKYLLEQFWRNRAQELALQYGLFKRTDKVLEVTNDQLLMPFTRAGKLEVEVILAKIPAKHPWEVFAELPIVGGRCGPSSREIMSVAKYWYETYGAIPAVLASGGVEFYLEQPVKDSCEAERLAKEHFAFCEEHVLQRTRSNTFTELAHTIQNSSVWRFWWKW